MKAAVAAANKDGNQHLSHFGPEANLLDELENLFKTYGETGGGKRRYYLHNDEEAAPYKQESGTFTPWLDLPPSDVLFYEGLHGAVKTEQVDIARYADLKVGVVPVINLEWIQKIHRDKSVRENCGTMCVT